MNNQRHNQHNPSQNGNTGNRSQYTNNHRPFSSRKDELERELRYLERDLVSLDVQIDALGEKGRLLEQAKNAHMASIPFAIAQVALSTFGVKYLPPVARTWHYKHQQYLRSEENLKQFAVTLYTKRNALLAQMEHIEIHIEMAQYQP